MKLNSISIFFENMDESKKEKFKSQTHIAIKIIPNKRSEGSVSKDN